MKKGLIIVLVLVVLGGVGFATYWLGFKDKNSSSEGSGSVLNALNSDCKYKDADLCKFINSWKEQKYYTIDSTTTDSEGKQTKMVMKIESDSKTQMIGYENDKEIYNYITIGSDHYTKDFSDDKWTKTTLSSDQPTETQTNTTYKFDEKAENATDTTTYKKIGTEACEKLTCFKYQVIDPSNTNSTEYIYFDNKDYQLRKIRSELKDSGVTESVYSYSKFTISVPSPIKEGANVGIPSSLPSTSADPSSISIPTDYMTEEME